MNLGDKEKRINLIRSRLKANREEFKSKLMSMKGGSVYNKWKNKIDKEKEEKERALQLMENLRKYLERSGSARGVFEQENIKKKIRELKKEIEDMKLS